MQSILAQWKKAGVETDLKLKEGNAFIASVLGRKYERLAMTLRGGPTTPDFYLFGPHMPGSPQNTAGVNDPLLAEMLKLQHRTFDEKKRREIIYDIQRLCSQQAYYLYVSPSAKVLSAWVYRTRFPGHQGVSGETHWSVDWRGYRDSDAHRDHRS